MKDRLVVVLLLWCNLPFMQALTYLRQFGGRWGLPSAIRVLDLLVMSMPLDTTTDQEATSRSSPPPPPSLSVVPAGSQDEDNTYSSVAVDPRSGDTYVIGGYKSASLEVGAVTLSNSGGTCGGRGCQDIFLAKLSKAGDVVWAKSLGTSGYDNWATLSLDPSGV